MILSEIKRYLIKQRQATLADIALHFDAQPDAVRGMLEQWMRRGKVVRTLAGGACGGSCNQCDPATVEIYRWIDNAAATSLSSARIVQGTPCSD